MKHHNFQLWLPEIVPIIATNSTWPIKDSQANTLQKTSQFLCFWAVKDRHNDIQIINLPINISSPQASLK